MRYATLEELYEQWDKLAAKEANTPDILQKASELVNGTRAQAYGDSNQFCFRCAKLWSAILKYEVEPRHVPLMMMGLKLLRQEVRNKEDNLVDLVGYVLLQERVEEL